MSKLSIRKKRSQYGTCNCGRPFVYPGLDHSYCNKCGYVPDPQWLRQRLEAEAERKRKANEARKIRRLLRKQERENQKNRLEAKNTKITINKLPKSTIAPDKFIPFPNYNDSNYLYYSVVYRNKFGQVCHTVPVRSYEAGLSQKRQIAG